MVRMRYARLARTLCCPFVNHYDTGPRCPANNYSPTQGVGIRCKLWRRRRRRRRRLDRRALRRRASRTGADPPSALDPPINDPETIRSRPVRHGHSFSSSSSPFTANGCCPSWSWLACFSTFYASQHTRAESTVIKEFRIRMQMLGALIAGWTSML